MSAPCDLCGYQPCMCQSAECFACEGSGDCWTTYTGQRVCALRQFYRAAEPELDSPAWRIWLAFDEQQAIAQAIGQGKGRKAA